MKRETYGPDYQVARAAAFKRTGGICSFCGLKPARDAHHWAYQKPVRPEHLIPLCRPCHQTASARRRMLLAGLRDGDWLDLIPIRYLRRDLKPEPPERETA